MYICSEGVPGYEQGETTIDITNFKSFSNFLYTGSHDDHIPI